MAWPLLETHDFDRGARRASLQTSNALAALLAAGGLSLSLVVVIAMLSFEIFHTTPTALLL